RAAWLVAVAQVLAAMHRLGLAHGDVKPENVIVRTDGLLKLVDFGMARVAQAELDATAGTLARALVEESSRVARGGTPAYRAREQLAGRVPDAKSDQYAWGVLAYELLTAEHPARAHGETWRSAALHPRDRAAVAPAIDAIVARATSAEP